MLGDGWKSLWEWWNTWGCVLFCFVMFSFLIVFFFLVGALEESWALSFILFYCKLIMARRMGTVCFLFAIDFSLLC